MKLAPFGEPPTEFTSVALANDSSAMDFAWPGRAHSECSVTRTHEKAWAGACVGRSGDARAVVFDDEYQPDLGEGLRPSAEDLKILDRAAAILATTRWNRQDERTCMDDRKTGWYSLFCALYDASIQVSGGYLHRRPALAAVRQAVQEGYAERVHLHTLQDFNNDAHTTRDHVVDVIVRARNQLSLALRQYRGDQ